MCDYARNDLVEATTPCGAYHPAARRPIPVIRPTPPRLRRAPLSCGVPLSCSTPLASCYTHPLSCCAQSQHPERLVERFTSGVPGFRDYARNDLVEATTPRGAYHPAARCAPPSCGAHPCHVARTPVMWRPPRVMQHPPLVMLRAVAASRKARRTIYVRSPWIPRLRAE